MAISPVAKYNLVSLKSKKEIANKLINTANENGGKDNITCIIIEK